MEEDIKLYASRIKRLSQLLREYEGYLNDWQKINLTIDEDTDDPMNPLPVVGIEFYRYVMRTGYNKKPTAHRISTHREFNFTIEELDKAIDRYRQKITYEKKKVTNNEGQ